MLSELFAGRLRELRTAAGLSQKQLADKTGMVTDFISRLERGERSPSWETVLALCAALGVECTAFTVAPKDEPAPQRGRPRKASAAEEAAADKPVVPESKKPAAKRGKRKKGGRS